MQVSSASPRNEFVSDSKLQHLQGLGNRIKKSLSHPPKSQLLLDDVLSDIHFRLIKSETRATLQRAARKERKHLKAQLRLRRAQHEAEMYQETQRLKEVADFAYMLVTLTGATVDHPWIQKLLEVADGSLDPRDLLSVYKSTPSKLAIIDPKDPFMCWLPSIPRSRQELLALSRESALEALVGKFQDGRNMQAFLYSFKINIIMKPT
ncbi:hypothetical protein COCOBI_01-8070 [Coccomyxa sp. Obi]|nr:hypothetical protein COCOBI_01-8070 [Coccomyxa sp. Obi]